MFYRIVTSIVVIAVAFGIAFSNGAFEGGPQTTSSPSAAPVAPPTDNAISGMKVE